MIGAMHLSRPLPAPADPHLHHTFAGDHPERRRRLAILTACVGGFLAFLDATIVNTAFPSLAASFPDASRADLSWVLDSYFIVIAALIVPAGGFADRLGRKRVFLTGLLLFVAASAACAAAPGWEALIGARIIQGVGAAIVIPVSLALILPEYPLAGRAAGVATWVASAALASAAGPPLGGLLVELSDWRLVFLVNVPVGVLLAVMARRTVAESVDPDARGVPDLVGSALTIGGLGLLALAIVEGDGWGWTSPRVLGAIGLALVLLALTARRCVTHARPIVAPELVRIPSFRRANVGMLLLSMAFFSTILGNILFLTAVWDYSALTAGLAVAPSALVTTIVAIPGGRLSDRFGYRAVILPGCLVYAAGILLVRSAGGEPDFLGLWLPATLLTGAGLGLAFPTYGAAALSEIPAAQFGSASAVATAARQFGGVLGTAVMFAAIGTPATLAQTLAAADRAYLFSVVWALAAGAAGLTLRPAPRAAAATAPHPTLADARTAAARG